MVDAVVVAVAAVVAVVVAVAVVRVGEGAVAPTQALWAPRLAVTGVPVW